MFLLFWVPGSACLIAPIEEKSAYHIGKQPKKQACFSFLALVFQAK
jgi:hypothetical protein